MSITEEMCFQAMTQLVNGQRLPESPGHHFTHSQIFDGKSTLFRLNYWNTFNNKLLWIAYIYDNRKINAVDIPTLCTNMTFGPSDLRRLSVGGIVAYDPDNNIEPPQASQVQRGGMQQPFGGMPGGQCGYQGQFPVNQPWFNQLNHPGQSQFRFGDYPPGPQIGDQPNMPDYTFGQQVRSGAHTGGFLANRRTANQVLARMLNAADLGHLATIRGHLEQLINGDVANFGEEEVTDGDTFEPKVHVAFDITRTDGPSEKGYLIIRRLLTDSFAKDGYRLEFTKYTTGFTIHAHIDV